MQISREDIARHYASLSEEELLELDPVELTDVALQCYEHEMQRRNLLEEEDASGPAPVAGHHDDTAADWLDTAATACSFQIGSGRDYAQEAERACAVLSDAGVPSEVMDEQGVDGGPSFLSVMVPAALSLKATSILDRDLFNQELEETWRAHFDELSDAQLRALHPDELCAGFLDRAARLKRVYQEALASRE